MRDTLGDGSHVVVTRTHVRITLRLGLLARDLLQKLGPITLYDGVL